MNSKNNHNRKNSAGKWGLLIALILLGLMMRSPISAIPMILKPLAQRLNVDPAQLSVLTTIPLVVFMLFSNFASKTANKLGLKRTVTLSAGLMTLGSLARLCPNFSLIVLGTILIGIGIAHLNVLMPAVIMSFVPNKIALYTTTYSLSMMLGVALCNLTTAPLLNLGGINSVMLILVGATLLALLVWIYVTRELEPLGTSKKLNKEQIIEELDVQPVQMLHPWKTWQAWAFLLTFGGQSLLNYTFVAWMPSLMDYHQVKSGQIGLIMSFNAFVTIIFSIIVPKILVSLSNRGITWLIILNGLLGVTSAVGLIINQNTANFWFWAFESMVYGLMIGGFFISVMTLLALKTSRPNDTAQLSGMTQTGGYLIAALGPSLYGIAFKANPTGMIQNIIMIAIVIVITISAVIMVNVKKFE
ncbi:cyanate permease [Weissella koreensis KACC 15510]|uniref:MFS transporter n=1 Tax=Weissella koreensis TaxID=165096 RepID=UPI0002175894|nr:MFS transporter [Weissella koreensis]AEJ22949.1 cyanate permease [Weissella koreensis KACC 15510]